MKKERDEIDTQRRFGEERFSRLKATINTQ